MADLGTLAFGGGFAVIGALVAYVGYERVRLNRALASHETLAPGEVEPGGAVKVKGRAEPVDGTHVAPVDGSEAVATEYEIEQQDIGDEGPNWQTLERETTVEPFRVEGDGSVLVADDDPPTIEVTDDSRAQEPIDRSELEGKRNLPIALSELSIEDTGDYRHSQKSIRPGQEVVVFGTAREARTDGGERGVVIGHGGPTDPFYLLDSEDALSSTTVYALVVLFGLVLVLVGAGVTARELLALVLAV